ncbi:MAG TPA: DUF6318 family protein, partial [Arthrobacter sp.]|nr:DUF6318 family protein [Arthrobacter sp.]
TPVETSTGTPSPAGDPTPSPDGPPTLPAAARGKGARAAKAFVRYYIATMNHAVATGDTSLVHSLSASDCESCASVNERIEHVYRSGGHIASAGWKIMNVRLVPRQPHRRPLVDVGLELSPQLVIKRAGASPSRFPGGRMPVTFHLARTSHGWVVAQWERSA